MRAIICDNLWRQKWDEFIKDNSSDFGLLQSWQWGEFQAEFNFKVRRLAIVDQSEKIKAVAQIIERPLKLGKSYWYVPRGPVACRDQKNTSFSSAHFNDLMAEIARQAKQQKGVVFLRLEPPNVETADSQLKASKLVQVASVQPRQTLILDLSPDEDKLLSQMKSKTRYNIKVAQKHHITIDEGQNYFDDFWRLITETARRDKFSSHSRDYYHKMMSALGGAVKLIVAKDGDKVIAGNLVVFFSNWAVYLHGASDHTSRQKMAPYLLQWQTIIQAKQSGYDYYDFWGVDSVKWPGVTRFKTGFAPHLPLTQYVGTWDEVYLPVWYNIYNIYKKIH